MRTLEERFWRKVDFRYSDGCWTWNASTIGYPPFEYGHFNGSTAHRYSYQLHHGDIPEGMFVCHTCDNPLCINPKHLFLGTAKDNSQDRINKGRPGSLGITPAKVSRAIFLYKQGEPLAAIQKATTIPLKHLVRIIAKYDLRFGDDSWTRLLNEPATEDTNA